MNSRKKVIFIVPNWEKPTELWLNRMILNIEDVLAGIGCPFPEATLWGNKIPAFSISLRRNIFTRVLKKAGLESVLRKLNEFYLLRKLNSTEIQAVSIHYLTLAATNINLVMKIRKPVFIHCHGYDVTWEQMDSVNPGRKVHSDDYIDKVRKLSVSSFFIANSRNTIMNLRTAGIPDERIFLCNYGIPVSGDIRENSSGELSILYLGRLVDFKGPELVMKAFDLACKKGLKATLNLAGDGPLRVTCELLKRELEFGYKINLPGEMSWEDGQALFSEADIFTAHNRKGPLTNQEEAFGVSVVEAMAAGIPVITGRNGGCTETVVHNETGILVEPGDIESHAEAFILLANNSELRHSFGENGRDRVKREFSTDRERQRLIEIYGL